MRFSKPPGFFPDKLIGYWIEHRTSRTSGSCGGHRASSIEHRASNIEHRTSNIETSSIEHRTGSRCLFKLFCLFACLFSFDKHRTSIIEHRTSNIDHRTSNIDHRTTGRSCGGNDPAGSNIDQLAAARGPVGLGHRPSGKGRFD